LGRLEGPEEYVILVNPRAPHWLDAYLGPNQKTQLMPGTRFESLKRLLGPWRVRAGKLWRTTRHRVWHTPLAEIPESNGFYEALGATVAHFPYQIFAYSTVPTIFNPHDLQHRHYPAFFSAADIAAREATFPFACRYARAIATPSNWVRQDVAREFALPATKIYAILYGAPTEFYHAVTATVLTQVRRKFRLPAQFAFYPAQTWQHKNHLRLIEALAWLRDREQLTLNLVCTGKPNEFSRAIEQRVRELRLETQVRFLGFIEPAELRALYHLTQFVIHPSLFEGGGLPILEAFREGAPVACSSATSLPEYAGDAALYFDPTNVESIADAAKQMLNGATLRESLRARGAMRVQTFTWERTAKMYRALYRKVGGGALSTEDCELLAQA